MQIILIALMIFLPLNAWTESVDITPEYIKQMGYMVSQPMPCDWDPEGTTTIFGYYGSAVSSQATEAPNTIPAQQGEDLKSKLFQVDLALPTQQPFGSYINLEFAPEMMEYNGMPAQIFSVDYKALRKRCPSGFSPDLMTK